MYLLKNISYLATKNSSIVKDDFTNHTFDIGLKSLQQIAKISGYSIDALINTNIELKEKISVNSIKILALDVDGVMTDGGMYYSENSDEFKKYNTKDGMAIKTLTAQGFHVFILSSGFNKNLIQRRADLLGVQKVFVGKGRKLDVLNKWCQELNLNIKNVAYIGDDINDLEIIKEAGLSACPNDAIKLIKNNVNLILNKEGGKGCIREFIDNYIKETK